MCGLWSMKGYANLFYKTCPNPMVPGAYGFSGTKMVTTRSCGHWNTIEVSLGEGSGQEHLAAISILGFAPTFEMVQSQGVPDDGPAAWPGGRIGYSGRTCCSFCPLLHWFLPMFCPPFTQEHFSHPESPPCHPEHLPCIHPAKCWLAEAQHWHSLLGGCQKCALWHIYSTIRCWMLVRSAPWISFLVTMHRIALVVERW